MTFNKKLLAATLLTAGGFAAISSANAATSPATSSFTTQTTVESICTITAPTNITLDSVQAGQATTALTSTTDLTLNCSKGDVAVISLTPASSGTADGLGYMVREGSTEQVKYKLTSDASGATPWGATAGTNTVSKTSTIDYATPIKAPIYLTVTNTADVTPGTYTDTINVSVSY